MKPDDDLTAWDRKFRGEHRLQAMERLKRLLVELRGKRFHACWEVGVQKSVPFYAGLDLWSGLTQAAYRLHKKRVARRKRPSFHQALYQWDRRAIVNHAIKDLLTRNQ